MRDLWAGNPYFDAGGTLLTRIEKRAFARADAVVTVTDSCADRMLALHPEIAPRLEVLPNGFDPVLLDLRGRGAPSGERATLVHAGTLYGDRSAVTLLRALSRPGAGRRARGSCSSARSTRDRGRELRRDHGDARGRRRAAGAVARRRSSACAAADVAVVINSPGTGGDMAAPSKLYEALALGTPVLALTNPGSESERLLERLGHDAGCAPPGDEAAIARAVARLIDAPPAPVDAAALDAVQPRGGRGAGGGAARPAGGRV